MAMRSGCNLSVAVFAQFEQIHGSKFYQQKYTVCHTLLVIVSRCTDLGWECCLFNLLPELPQPQPFWVGGRQHKVLGSGSQLHSSSTHVRTSSRSLGLS